MVKKYPCIELRKRNKSHLRQVRKDIWKWSKKLAQPKKEFFPPPISRGPKSRLKKLLPRILKLSVCLPRKVYKEESCHMFQTVNPFALLYKATPHMIQLATPLKRKLYKSPSEESINWCTLMKVSESAKRYKATKRIIELSTCPKRKRYVDMSKKDIYRMKVKKSAMKYVITAHLKELTILPKHRRFKKQRRQKPGYVKKKAKKAIASPRVVELAKPKDRSDKSCKKNPFGVRKGATKAEASERVKQLAVCLKRKFTPKYVPTS